MEDRSKMSVLIVKQEKKMELIQAVFYFLYQNYSQMPTEEWQHPQRNYTEFNEKLTCQDAWGY